MLNAKNILLPYDFSEAAEQAAPYAFDLAARAGATLHLFCAEVLYGNPSIPAGVSSTAPERTREHLQQVAKKHAHGSAHAADVRLVHATGRDITAEAAIVRYAAAQDIDLIVMGTHGRRGLRHLALGSVAEKVVRQAPCPVLTTRGRAGRERPADERGVPEITRILAPTDFSAAGREALRCAKALAADFGAEVELFHAVEETLHPAFYGPAVQSVYDADPNVEAKVVERLKAFYHTTEGAGGEVRFSAGPGPAPRAIAERARAWKADLIVMPTRPRTGLAHFAAGGTAEKVVRQAPCPVLTSRSFGRLLSDAPGEGAAKAAAPALAA